VKVIHCCRWQDYPQAIESIREEFGRPEIGGERHDINVLFRGQADATWDLQTTLERRTRDDLSVETYLRTAYSISGDIEELTGVSWELDSIEANLDAIRNGDHGITPRILSYPYLIYLRHHGFPSPLLDWSRSEYVAAYFALNPEPSSDRAAVYVFIEHPNFVKSILGRQANISTYTHNVKTHCRHFAQLCQYTIATKMERGLMTFCPHDEVFARGAIDQDLVFKVTVPLSAREDALQALAARNIRRDTLFHPEDVLIQHLAEAHYGE